MSGRLTIQAPGRTTRVRGLAPWQPRPDTCTLLEAVRAVLAEYADFLPLTLRQIFYRLVGAHGYDKTETAYARLGEALNRARRAGLIAFDAIRDDDARIVTRIGWNDPVELIDAWRDDARTFRFDRQQRQPGRLLIMVEARGMQPQIATAAEPYGVPVVASGGFDSLTAKYDLACALGQQDDLTVVLHIGDHDPSGTHLFRSLAADVAALIHDRGLAGQAKFERLAVTPAQISELNLPTAPPKPTDRRSFEGETVQAEAITPDVLARIVREAIEARMDLDELGTTLAREKHIQDALTASLNKLIGGGEAQS